MDVHIVKAMTLTTGLTDQKRNMVESIIIHKLEQFTPPFRQRLRANTFDVGCGDGLDVSAILYGIEMDASFS